MGYFELVYIAQGSVLVPIVIWLLLVRKPGVAAYFIFISLLVSALFDGLQDYFAYRFSNNIIVSNIYPPFHLLSFTFAYYLHTDFTLSMRRIIGATGLIGMIWMGTNIFLHGLEGDILVPNLTILSIVSILFTLNYFVHKIYFTKEFDILKHPFFYITCAIFLNQVTLLAIYTTYNLLSGMDGYETLWQLKLVVSIVYNIVMAFSFYILNRYKNFL